MKIRTRLGGGAAALALIASLAVAPPAQATWTTTAQNTGSAAIVVSTMSGGVRTLYPGQSVYQARSFALGLFQCATDNGVKRCNNTIGGTQWFSFYSGGYHSLKRVYF